MTKAPEMWRWRRIYRKFIVGFWRLECLTRQHEKNCSTDFAASDSESLHEQSRGYNAGLLRAHAFAFRQPTRSHDLQSKFRGGARRRSARSEAGHKQCPLHRNDRTSRARFSDLARFDRQDEPANSRAKLSQRSGFEIGRAHV